MESYSLGVQRSILGPDSRRVVTVNMTFAHCITVFSVSLETLRRSLLFGVLFYTASSSNLYNVNSRIIYYYYYYYLSPEPFLLTSMASRVITTRSRNYSKVGGFDLVTNVKFGSLPFLPTVP